MKGRGSERKDRAGRERFVIGKGVRRENAIFVCVAVIFTG